MKKTRAELELEAQAIGLDLSYMPEPVILNIFECGEEKWQKSMSEGIGSSGASAAVGKSPYKTATEVAMEKSYGRSKPIADGDPDKQFMLDSGHQMEVAILKWYAAKIGYVCALTDPSNPSTSDILDVSEITPEMWDAWEGKGVVCVDHARYAHPNYPFMFTDMDGVVYPPNRSDMWVAECKTSSAETKDFKWNWRSGVWGEPNVTIGNLGYIDQARHHMCVANADRCDIICANGFNAANIAVITVYRDMEEEKKLIEAEGKLWEQVEEGEIPSFTTISDRSYENIAYILTPPEEERVPEPIVLPESNRAIVNEVFSLQSEIDQLKGEITRKQERMNALYVSLIKEMGEHSIATMPSATEGKEIRLELKATYSTRLDEDKFKLTDPEGYKEYDKLLKKLKKDYEDSKDQIVKPLKEQYPKICGGDAKFSVKEKKVTAPKKGA